MLTKIDICSMALLKLGEAPIQSLSDDTASAQLARTLFDTITDTLIASYPWRFATCTTDLTRCADGDFLIPSDILRIIDCPGKITGNKIICAGDSITITALRRVTPENMPTYFASLLATKLAMEFCVPLSGDNNVFRMLIALYESEFQSAKFIDGTSSSPQQIKEFSLLNSRF